MLVLSGWKQTRHVRDIINCYCKIAGIDLSRWNVAVESCTKAKMLQLNHQYRAKARTTDILSFKLHDHRPREPLSSQGGNLGEILICLPYIQSRFHSRSKIAGLGPVERRVERVLAHGIGHLLGYDHENLADYREMYVFERKLVSALYKQRLPRRGHWTI